MAPSPATSASRWSASAAAKWVVVLRTKGSVKKSGSFSRDIPRLSRGNYRVSGNFEGTGTSKPSRSSAKPFRA